MKTKKNEIAALRQEHSATALHGKTTRYDTYCLVEVASVDRAGIVQKYRKAPGGPAYITANRGQQILVISSPDRQAAARRLFEQQAGPWGNMDDITGAIING